MNVTRLGNISSIGQIVMSVVSWRVCLSLNFKLVGDTDAVKGEMCKDGLRVFSPAASPGDNSSNNT